MSRGALTPLSYVCANTWTPSASLANVQVCTSCHDIGMNKLNIFKRLTSLKKSGSCNTVMRRSREQQTHMYVPCRYSCANCYRGLPQASAAWLKRCTMWLHHRTAPLKQSLMRLSCLHFVHLQIIKVVCFFKNSYLAFVFQFYHNRAPLWRW